jgi:hypothetical protein
MVALSRDPDTRNATTIPGNTACDIASPTIAIFLKIRKHPNNAQLDDTNTAVIIIYTSFIFKKVNHKP